MNNEIRERSGLNVMLKLIGLVKPLAGYMIIAILMGLAGHLCASFITIFGGYAILDVMGYDTGLTLVFIGVSVVVFALVRAGFRYAEQSCNHFIAFRLLAIIRDKVFKALRSLCPAKLEGRDRGNLISVITSDIELLEVFYAHTISPIAIAILYTIIMCIYIGSFHWMLAVVALAAYIVTGVLIPFVAARTGGSDGMTLRTRSGELSSFVLDSLRGIQQIIQFDAGSKRLADMNSQTDELLVAAKQMKNKAGVNTAVTNVCILASDVIMLIAGTLLYVNGRIGFDGVLLTTLALFSSFGPAVALAALGSTLQSTFAAGNRVLNILEEEPVIREVSGNTKVEFDGISSENVTFAYASEKILDDFSIDIHKGEVTGIIGKSGSGKSTLLKLFMRFWDADSGTIRIGKHNIKNINTTDLRDMESYMTQDTHLFCDSIRNNIRIAKLDATDEEIEAACKKASIHDFIMTLPKGYDTSVGELGDTLSGGEKQRIGLARVFLHDAKLVLLDEPTSNLDSLNEAVILRSLARERKDKTVVLVSHRQSTMRITDRTYSVEAGRVS